MVKVKICGITSKEIAMHAIECGADAIGFVFSESRRKVLPELVREITSSLPPFATTVGVFVDEHLHFVQEVSEYCKLSLIQLHGSEDPEYCRKLSRPVIKVIKVATAEDLKRLPDYHVQALLLDTFVQGEAGGSGKVFPWHLAQEAKKYAPIIVAGGLNSENVMEAIKVTTPYGVDVSSGVETNGAKDRDKIFNFIKRCKGCIT